MHDKLDGDKPHARNRVLQRRLDDALKEARIALIYKKGDTEKLENYRPIALLNTIYKLYASILKQRLETGLDAWLQKTQFGFRKNKSTAQAIHFIRRLMGIGKSSTATIIISNPIQIFN